MSPSNKVTLAKLCKQHYHVLPIANHRHRYLLPRCLSSRFLSLAFTKISARKAKQSIAFSLLLLAGIFTTPLSAQITTGTGGICDRTTEVQVEILALIFATNDCAAVTATQLAAITSTLSLSEMGISALQAGDFAGLTSLTFLTLNRNFLSELPAGIFDDLTSLTILWLFNNDLTTIEANTFSGLMNLDRLFLSRNALTTIEAGAFSGLTSLTNLQLFSNDLTTIGANTFSGLTSLTDLGLSDNALTTLPANAFSGLTSLTNLGLRDNALTTLPANAFSGLTSLDSLSLDGNTFTTPLPANLFDPLPDGALIRIDLSPIGDLPNVALAVGGTTMVTVSDAFISRDGSGADRTLSFTITPANTAVATAIESGGVVSITAIAMGMTNVTITADDGGVSNPATQTISVTGTDMVVNFCDRTDEVETVILAAIPANPACDAVTATQLAAIDRLDLSNMSITTLQSGDFVGLSGLTTLSLSGNALSTLLANIFNPLTSLTTLDLSNNSLSALNADTFSTLTNLATLRLQGNTFTTALPADVFDSLSDSTIIQIDLSPIGDLADIPSLDPGTTTTINVAEAFISKDADGNARPLSFTITRTGTSVTSATESGGVVTITASNTITGTTDMDITAGDGTGMYTRDIAVTVEAAVGICSRTAQVRAAILARISETNDCAAVKATQLAAITGGLSLSGRGITTLQSGDFAGLTSLTTLHLAINSLTALPMGVFNNLGMLTTLTLNRNSLSELPAGIFDDLTSLTSLTLNDNSIATLETNVFSALSGITTLNLRDNSIATINANAFNGLSGVTELNLRDNALTMLPANAFSGLTSLTRLDLDGNALTTIEADTFSVLTSLTILDLSNNSLSALNADTFSTLTNLASLRLQGNTFTTPLPADVFDSLSDSTIIQIDLSPIGDLAVALDTSGMITIDLSEAFISRDSTGTDRAISYSARSSNNTAVATVSGSGRMLTITATGNGTTTVSVTADDDASIFFIPFPRANVTRTISVTVEAAVGICSRTAQVQTAILARISETNDCAAVTATQLAAITGHLGLSARGIETLQSGDFAGLTSITFLNLFGNALTTIEADIFSGLTSLTTLDLEHNALTTIEAGTFSALTTLTSLDLNSNNLRTIDANLFSGLTRLTFLNLFGNALTTIEADTFSALTTLTGLNLNDTALTTIEAGTFSALTSLTRLGLSNNALTTIEADTFSTLTSLTRLDLDGNALTTIEADTFSTLTSLTRLGLSNNALTTIEADTFSTLTSLTTLDLDGNALTTIEANTFSGLTSLTTLDLSGNALTTIEADTFSTLTSLTTLDLESNNLTTLPAGLFDNLASLTELFLDGNPFTTPLPADIFNSISSANIAIDLSPIGDLTGVALSVGGTTTINVRNAFISRDSFFDRDRTLSYTLTPPNTAVATATESSGVLTITGAGAGTTTVSVTADDGESGAVGMHTRDIAVTVVATGILAFDGTTGYTTATPVVVEASGTDTFYVQLASAPANDVTLTLTNSDTNEGTVSPPTLTFTAAAGATSWDTRQAVTVTAVDDGIVRDDSFTVNFAVTTGDGVGGTYPTSLTLPSVTVTVTDDDSAGLALFEESTSGAGSTEITAITTGEPDTPTTFYVALTSVPASTVTVTVTSTDTTEGTITTGASLVFSSTTWDTPRQAVTVTGVDDSDADVDTSYSVILASASSDTNYNALADTTVTATNTDDDAVNICDRTTQVETAILNAISTMSPPACDAVPVTQLATIDRLDLFNMSIISLLADDFADLSGLTSLDLGNNLLSTLPAGIFNPLTALTSLDLSFNSLMLPSGIFSTLTNLIRLDLQNTGLSALPAGIFSGLTSLSTLRLHDNAFTTALPADIFEPLPDAALIEIDLSPIGDLADISSLTVGTTTTINVSGAFISRDAMGDDRDLSFTITRTGTSVSSATESGGVVTITASSTVAGTTNVNIIADDDNFGPNANFTRTVAVTVADVVVNICSRTSQVQAAILARISETNDCAAVTAIHLAAITGNALDLGNKGITTLQSGDFAGLTSLTTLLLGANSLTALPDGIFDELTSLTQLDLSRNALTTIETNTFSSLTSLGALFLNDNALTTIEADTFSALTRLTRLVLFGNALTTLKTGTFSALMSLTGLDLRFNALSTIKADTFSGLMSLTRLDLDQNTLTTIEADTFSALTTLTELSLLGNSLSTLPAGIFDNLMSLTELSLDDNPFTTPLPADIFDPLTSATIQIDLSPIGDLDDVALTVGGTTTINVANAFISKDDDGNDRTLSYTLTPADTAVATAMESNGVVTITGAGMGATTVSVTADDRRGGTVGTFTRNFAVTVVATGILAFDEATGNTAATVVAAENNGTDTFYVQLASAPANDVTLSVMSGDTNEGTVSPPTLTFTTMNWNTRQALTVTAVNDNSDRDDTFMVDFMVTSGTGNYDPATLTTLPSVTVTVTDDDTAGIGAYDMLTAGNEITAITTSETAGTGNATTFYVELTSQPTGTVTVTIGGIDTTEHTLTTPASGTLTFDSTNWNTPRQAITITGVDDDIVDGDQIYDLTLTATSGGYTGVTAPTVSITNEDDDTAALSIADTTIDEDAGTATVTVTLSPMVTATGDITVDVTTIDGTATSTDYTAITSQTLTFTAGTISQTLDITISDDNIDETDETFTVMLDNLMLPTGVTTVSIADDTATVTITDDDVTPTGITLSVNPATVPETADATEITITATIDGTAVLSTETVVTVSVGGGTATSGTDYTAVPNFDLTIPALSLSATGTFMIDPNTSSTNGDTVTIGGTAPSFTTVNTATLTILEAGISVFDMASGGTSTNMVTIANENSGTMTFYVRLISAPASDVTLSVMSSDTNEGMVTPTTLTFTTANWDDRQALTITAVPDNVDRDGDSFMVDFAVTAGDGVNYTSLLDLSGVTVTITDDDTASTTIALSVSPSTIAETAGATTITVTAVLEGTVVLPTATDIVVTMGGGTATVTTDYTATPSTLTITIPAEAASATQTFTITPVDDGTVDNNETVTISGTAGGFTVNAATLNIVEASISVHDAMTLGSQTSTTTIAEASGTGMRYVQLASPPETGSSVTISVASSDTNEGTVSTPTLTFSDTDWNVRQPITVTAVPDNVDRDDTFMVNFAVTGGDGGNYTSSLMLPSVMVTITDDDTLSDTINLSVSPLSVAETADATTITVTATIEGTAVSTTDTTVTVSVGGGTATSGTDYTAVSDFTLTIPALSLSAMTTFMIDPTEDTTDDNNETVMITGTAAGFTTINPATLTIVEAGISVHDAMMDGNQTSTTTIAEASGTGMLYVQLTSEPAASSSVTISVASSDTNEGTVSTPTLTFSDTNWDTRQLITITAVPDNVDRDGDSFMVDFAVMSGDSANYTSSLMLPSVMVTVTDDDTVGLTVVDGGGVTTSEGSATPDTFTVVLDSEPTAEVTVEITGLRAGEHSLTPSSTLTFTIGDWDAAQTVTLNSVDDDDVDGDQTYDLTLTPTGGGYGGVMAETVSITNTDDDTATLSIADLSVDEDAGTATLTVTLTPAVTAGDIAVDLTTADGTATSTDYTALTSQTLTFTAGSTSETLDITINDDSIDELDETFTVMLDTLVQPTGVTTVSIADSTATVTITDDDTAGIALFDMATGTDAPSTTTSEGATTDTFYVALESQPTDTVTVTVTSGDPSEGTITTGASLTFTTTDWNSRQPVTVTGQNDDDVDGDQTYDLTLTATGGGYNSVTAQTVSVTNTDDDTAALSIADISVNENAGMATVTVTLTPAVTAGTVTVDGTIADGTATIAGGDYTAITSQTLTFIAGSTSETLDITINDDTIDELDETFTVTLDNLVLPTTVTGDVSITDATATVTITDDDVTPTGITLSVNPSTIADTADATEITVTATIDGTVVLPTDTVVTVSVGDVSDSATEGTDYVTVNDFTLTIPALSSSAMGTFTIDPNTLSTNGDMVTIDGTAGTFTFNATTLNIVEASISVFDAIVSGSQISTVTIADEASGTGTLYVQLASAPAGNVTLSVESSDTNEGTVTPATLTFSDTNWNSRQALTITAVPDNVDRDGDSFMVDFAVTGGDGVNYTSLLDLSSVTVTVTDDDMAANTIALSVNPSTVAETAGTTTITVTATLDGTAVLPTETVVTVSVGDVSDSATEGTDYVTVNDFTLTIPALSSSATQTFTIDPTNDGPGDNNETVTISGAATINGTAATVTVTTLNIVEAGILAFEMDSGGTSITTATIVNENNGTGTLYVQLASAPAGNVTLSVESDDTNEGMVTPTTLTFTTANWDDRQALTITAVPDNVDRDGDSFMVDFAVTAGDGVNYTSSLDLSGVTVTITDDDTASTTIALSVSPSTIAETAGATTITVTAVLEGTVVLPTATDIVVTMGGGTATVTTDYTATPSTLTITIPAEAASATQTFTITPVDDGTVDNNETVTITGTAGGFTVNAATLNIVEASISVHDAMTLGSQTSTTTIAEASGTGMRYVQLASPPETGSSVTISVASSDTNEGTVSTPTLTFSDTDWNVRQPITVTAVPDNVDRDDTFMVNFAVTGGDGGNYTSSLMLPSVMVTITDDDTLSDTINLSVSPLSVAETADATTITVTATIEGTAVSTTDTTVTVSVGGGTATSGTDYTAVSDFTLTIPALSLSAMTTFMIDPTEDTTDDNNETVMITGTAAGFTTINPATLTIVEAGISVHDAMTLGSQTSTTTIAEASGTGMLYVQLTSEPAASSSVTISVASSDTNEGMVTPPTLTFSDTNWDTRQLITITAVPDNVDRDGDSFMVDFAVMSGDSANYTSSLMLPSVMVTVTDDDTVGLTVVDGGGVTTSEGSATPDTFTVVLDSEPTAEVTVEITGLRAGEHSLTPSSTLTFTIGDWDAAQTVTLNSVDDDDVDGDQTYDLTLTPTGGGYGGVMAETVSITNTDDDTATLSIADLSVDEDAGTATLTVTLTPAVTAGDIAVDLTTADGTATSTDYTALTSQTLTFTAGSTSETLDITINDDSIDELDETFTVMLDTLVQPTGVTTVSIADSTATVTITDDDTAGIALFDMATGTDAPSTTTSEGATTDTFYVALESQPTDTVTVTVTSGDPSEGTITTGASLTFTTTDWNSRQPVTVTGQNDDDVDGDQTYDLTLTATGGGYNSVTAQTVSVTNTDDDTAALSIADISVNENAGMATVTVTLTPAVTAGTVTVDGTIADGTATIAGGDYTAITSQTLTFIAGSTSETLDITINDDTIDELDETFTVTLDNLVLPTTVTGDVSITDATATVTITDDDTLSDTINLSVSPLSVAETADATTITVTATIEGTAVSTTDTTVTVSVGGGTATSGTDYTAVSDFTLTIPALSLSAMTTFMIDPTEDTTDDNNETVMITGTAAGFTTINPATLTIVEAGISVHDAMMDGNQTSTTTIAEASGTGMLYVQLTSPPAGNVTLSVESDDTNEGMVTPPTLTFSDTNWDTRQLITITAVPDNVDRDGDSFMVDFAVMSGDSANYTSSLMLPSVMVTVTDDDTVGLTVVDGGGVTTSEGSATPDTFTVVLDSEPTAEVTVEITGLRAGEHSLTPSSTLTFTIGDWDAAQTVTLNSVDDDDVDGDQTYDLTLTPTGGGYGGVMAETVSITNTDDDTATLSIADLSVDEDAGTATLTVTLTPAVTAGDIAVDLTTADGTATSTDYTALTSQTLTFTAGSTSETLDITINDDSIDELDETFTVMLDTLVQPTGVTTVSIADSTATVTITDDDTAGIALFDMATGTDAPSTTTSEGATTDTFYVALESQPTDTVTVTVTSGDPSEGTITTGASLTFTTTDWNSRQPVTVTGQNDDDVDGDQTYDLTLTATGGGYNSVTAQTVSVTNTDDDTAALSIADISVNENAGMATVTVTLTPAVTAGTVTVDGTIADGTATIAGGDYTAITSQTLTFIAGSTSETLDITINDDTIDELDETFTVTLDNLVLPTTVTGDVSITDATATVTITDDDTLSDTINLSVSPLSVAETADATTITVTATIEGTAVSTTDTTVTVSVGGGTATSGTDYTAVSDFTLTIPALSLSAMTTFMIDPTEDTTDDNNETVMITGTAAGFTTINPATLTIVEAGISVHDAMMDGNQTSTTTIAEASGTGMLYVQLTSPPAGNVTLSVESDDTNEGMVTPPTLTFSDTNWDTRQLITITAVPDNVDRDGDSFMVDFAVMSGDSANYTSSLMLPSVMVTVTDDDTPSTDITLTISRDSIQETAGETSITVTAALGGAVSTIPTEVTVTVGGGTGMNEATVTIDYTLSIPTATLIITIPALETSSNGVFTITPIADNENDNEETITISGAASINSNPVTVNSATLTITGFSEEEQQVIEQTVAAQASSVTQVVSENIGSFLASRTSAPAPAPAPAPDGGGGGDVKRENFTNIDWQDWQERFAKLAYEGLKRMDSGADMSLDWALKAAGSDGRLLMPLSIESLTLWAAGGRLKTKGDGMGEYDGGVNSFVVGVDTNLINNWLLGMAASYSDSQVDYTMDGAPIGTTAQNLYSVHPFLSHRLPDHGLTLWVTGGYGVGDIDFSHTTNGEASSDVTQWMAAGGIEKHIITNTLWQGALRLKGLWGNATVDSTEYDNGVDIRKVESTFWRARMESEMGYNFQLPGANIRPYALIGGRWDHNDAIVSGDEWHIDIGGGVEVLSGNAFALNISLHTQVTDGDTEEDSIVGTGSLTYDIGQDRQGLQITLSRPLNNTSPAWDQHSFNEVTDKVSGVNSAPLTSELAYGWTVRPFALEGALQTYVQNSFDSHDRHYAVGLELVVNALTLNFETGYGEADNTGLESLFKTKIRW